MLLRLSASVATLVGLTIAVSDQTVLTGEVGLLEAVNDIPTWAGWPLRVVMQLGTLAAALVVVVAVTWRTRASGRAPGAVVLVAVALAYRLDNVIKDVVDRPRPPAVVEGLNVRERIGGFGFPSGHTTMAFALAASLHPIVPRQHRWVLWTLATVVGVARMHVGVHWPADVAGGGALGIAIGSVAWLAVTALEALVARRSGAGVDPHGPVPQR